jgi:ATP-dependent DNA helicase DinG
MIICFDLETTGLDKYNDRIIEIAMIKFDEKTYKVIDTFNSLVNPQTPIPELISNITNIYDNDVIWAPILEDLKNEILDFVWDYPLLGHNINFDVDFFINNWIDVRQNIIIDTFFLSNILSFNEPSLNLEMLCNSFWIWFEWAHRALNDAKATIKLFKKLTEKFYSLTKIKKHLLYFIFNKSEDRNIYFLREFLFNNIDSNLSFKDFEMKILKIVGKLDTEEKLIVDKKIDNKNMSNMFDMLWSVEKRDNQLKMTNMVMDSFTKKKKVVIEAPTWLWKSFAYLIPSIMHSVKSWEKVFVSTKTKALQDQLYWKDLFFLKNNLWINFNYAKLKWKKNYLSIKLFFDEFWIDDINYAKVWFLSKILLWLHETKYWELDEISYFWQEFSFLKSINSDNFSVLTEKNNYRRYEYLFKARVRLESSNVIIINHSLLFSDINTETTVLWKIQNLVIDEWHNIEDSVTDSLKQSYSLNNLNEQFDIIEKILTKINAKKIEFLQKKWNLISKLELLDDYWFNYLDLKIRDKQSYKLTLLKPDFFENADFSGLLKKIELDFMDIVDKLAIEEEYDFTKEIGIIQGTLDIIKIMLDKKADKKYIRIVNYGDNFWVSFDYTLLNPWEYLRDNLWNKLKSCILTSATLQIWWKFDYFKTLLFLEDFNFYSFESDFDYKKQATLFIPTDIWNIKNNTEEMVNFLWKFFKIVRWKVLTLLTSYAMIKKIYTSLNADLKKEGIKLYAQWVAWSKIKLLSFFLDNPNNSILLWTNSFWEWIDIPWDDLKYLVIHKFPFAVPTDPIFQARSVFFKDPFLEYSVPKAIIKLKQWFWRLIRTKSDNWIVILLDDRIISTSWWNAFFDAFPDDINIKKWRINNFLDILEKKL